MLNIYALFLQLYVHVTYIYTSPELLIFPMKTPQLRKVSINRELGWAMSGNCENDFFRLYALKHIIYELQ